MGVKKTPVKKKNVKHTLTVKITQALNIYIPRSVVLDILNLNLQRRAFEIIVQ